jgi:hypothetical protein
MAWLSITESGMAGALGRCRKMPSGIDFLSIHWEEFRIMGNN